MATELGLSGGVNRTFADLRKAIEADLEKYMSVDTYVFALAFNRNFVPDKIRVEEVGAHWKLCGVE